MDNDRELRTRYFGSVEAGLQFERSRNIFERGQEMGKKTTGKISAACGYCKRGVISFLRGVEIYNGPDILVDGWQVYREEMVRKG